MGSPVASIADAPTQTAAAVEHHFYLSAAVVLFDAAALDALLATSRRNNAHDGLSGMLIYQDGAFAQYLEGPKENLERTLARIYADLRHRQIIRLTAGPAERRLFTDWSMGFADSARIAPKDGAFDLSWRSLEARLPETYPQVVRTMMLQVYASSRAGR